MVDKIPDGIQKIHIIKAIEMIEKGITNNFSDSTEYDVLFNEKRYAPKAVIGVASSILINKEFYPRDFKGGLGSKCFKILLNNGFNIVTKAYKAPFPDEISDEYKEGRSITIYVNRFERNEKARKKCIETYGATCQVCEFDFEKTYGIIGLNFIHVHHILPLAHIGKEYLIDPIKDLRPVCPNCHAMLHKSEPPFTIQELKKIIESKKVSS